MINNTLTPTQRMYVKYIKDYKDEYGDVPSITRIAIYFKKSFSTVYEMLGRLESKGYIKRGYYERYDISAEIDMRTVNDFKKYLIERVKNPEILKIILSY